MRANSARPARVLLAILLPLACAASIYGLMRAGKRPSPRIYAAAGAAFIFLLMASCTAINIWADANVPMAGF